MGTLTAAAHSASTSASDVRISPALRGASCIVSVPSAQRPRRVRTGEAQLAHDRQAGRAPRVAAVLPREDRRDALVGPFSSLADLPQGAVIGTSSVRRRALLLHHRPDLEIRLLRGNVNTRIAAMREGRFDAIILAMAGLRRLGLDVPHSAISPDIMLPSAGQGALAIQARNADDSRSQAVIDAAATIGCAATTTEVTAERALLGRLDGSCHTPIAASATLQPDGRLHLDGMILSTDGSNAFRDSLTGVASDAVQIGVALADQLLGAAGGRDFLA